MVHEESLTSTSEGSERFFEEPKMVLLWHRRENAILEHLFLRVYHHRKKV